MCRNSHSPRPVALLIFRAGHPPPYPYPSDFRRERRAALSKSNAGQCPFTSVHGKRRVVPTYLSTSTSGNGPDLFQAQPWGHCTSRRTALQSRVLLSSAAATKPEEKMKVIPLLVFLFMLSGAASAAPVTDKSGAWWGHSSNHHRGTAARPHTGRRNLSTHPERRRRVLKH
jgi:hypothetical protein